MKTHGYPCYPSLNHPFLNEFRREMRRCALTALLLSVYLLTGGRAFADGVSITTTPMFAEVSAAPGTQQTGVITLKHESPAGGGKPETAVHLRVYVMDWTFDAEGNPQFLKAGSVKESCSLWTQVNPVDLTVQPGASAQVRYTLTVPPNAQGTYRAMIMFETDAAPATVGGQKVAINGRLGSALYVLAGPQTRRAHITGFAVADGKTTLNIENTGTTHVRLRGRVEYHDAAKHLLAQAPLPSAVVLSGKDNLRTVRVDTPHLPPGAAVTATAILDYGGDVLLGARCHVANP